MGEYGSYLEIVDANRKLEIVMDEIGPGGGNG